MDHARIILETKDGANLLELQLQADQTARLGFVTVIIGQEVYRLQLHPRRPILSSVTPPPDKIKIPSPATPLADREGWTCPNPVCNSLIDTGVDTCPWCDTTRPSAE
ncbi:hypothetical protein GTY62_15180 [Streptomyces sp. SID724]|uniref:hypothetical protein n=1 Tax=Streptomyces sp. SID724 TaxID=2690324 RepID=UPI0013616304|nr:hypothetical protein [Streptomyces sp. SID724]